MVCACLKTNRPDADASGGASPALQQVVVCGPSGVGKSTLVAKLLAELPDRLGFAVSCTTRDARPGEVDGAAAGLKWGRPSLRRAHHEPPRLSWRLSARLSNPEQRLGGRDARDAARNAAGRPAQNDQPSPAFNLQAASLPPPRIPPRPHRGKPAARHALPCSAIPGQQRRGEPRRGRGLFRPLPCVRQCPVRCHCPAAGHGRGQPTNRKGRGGPEACARMKRRRCCTRGPSAPL